MSLWRALFLLVVGLGALSVTASPVSAGAAFPWEHPGAAIETVEETALGSVLHGYYLDSGMKLVRNARAEAVWAKLLPVFRRSFARVACELIVFDREDPDIMSVPGRIYVSTGTISRLSDDELAAIVAHEFVHAVDSSRLKELQYSIDIGEWGEGSPRDVQSLSAYYRGHLREVGPPTMLLEQTALIFGVGMASEAGFAIAGLKSAWSKLTSDFSVEFDDYVHLHGLQGQMLDMMSSQLEALEAVLTDAGEPDAASLPPYGWSLDAYTVSDRDPMPVSQAASSIGSFGRAGSGRDFAVGRGKAAFLPLGEQYWCVTDAQGRILNRLDARDNLFLQYSSLELSSDGAHIVLTTQQDVIVYDALGRSSRWMGLGRSSRLSGDGALLAYTDGDVVFVKEVRTGRLVTAISPSLDGSISSITWEPSGARLILTEAARPSVIHVVDIALGTTRAMDLGYAIGAEPMWGTDGATFVAWGANRGGLTFRCYDVDAIGSVAKWTSGLSLGPAVDILGMDACEYGDHYEFAFLLGTSEGDYSVAVAQVSAASSSLRTSALSSEVMVAEDLRWLVPGEAIVISVLKSGRPLAEKE